MTRRMLAAHRWLGLVAGTLILLAAGTALGLNHQDMLRRPTPTGGPYGRHILAVAADPRDPAHVLMGTADGLFRSPDGGRTWEDVVLPVPAEQANALAFDPRRPGVVYAAFRQIGVYRSDDDGAVWEEVLLPFNPVEGPPVSGLSVAEDGGLLVATPQGLYRRAGAAWAHVPAPRPASAPGTPAGRVLHDLHDGRFWGQWGVPITDAVCLALVVLVLTGYALFAGRALRARRRA